MTLLSSSWLPGASSRAARRGLLILLLPLAGCGGVHLHVHYHRGDPSDPKVTLEQRVEVDPTTLKDAAGDWLEEAGRAAREAEETQ